MFGKIYLKIVVDDLVVAVSLRHQCSARGRQS
jgi:hypothetical protein